MVHQDKTDDDVLELDILAHDIVNSINLIIKNNIGRYRQYKTHPCRVCKPFS